MRSSKKMKLFCLIMAFVVVFSGAGFVIWQNMGKAQAGSTEEGASTFSWDNATVYFLLTDRFNNGNTSNDHSYNRGLDKNGNVVSGVQQGAFFQGGDFAGITDKIEEGYFDDLGVNALWVSAPYEQIHGYVVGGDGDSYAHYSYHGYYALDYTQTDANFGTAAEFKTLVDTAHEHGIRIVLDIVMNHAGYNTIYDMSEYGFGTLKSGWQDYYWAHKNVNNTTYHSYIDYTSSSSDWGKWWGSSWLRAGLPGYTEGGSSEQTLTLNGLPDFKTENSSGVSIPTFLANKWKAEGRYDNEISGLNSWLSSNNKSMTVTNTLSYWLSEWVREYGVDGFRCDTAKHVDLGSWNTLKQSCVSALKDWKSKNPSKALDDEEFWMTGEAWGHQVEKDGYFTSGGFDSIINFETQGAGVLASGTVASTYNRYANSINNDDSFNVLSYISSHDSVLCRGNSIYNGSAFLLLPGAVQIFYGDETDRPVDYNAPSNGDHQVRSFMNWNGMNSTTLAHWQKVGSYRNNHIAVGAGANAQIGTTSGNAFTRVYNKNGISDKIAFCFGANANSNVTLTVSSIWEDGQVVENAYDGSTADVVGGKVSFNSGANGTILLQAATNTNDPRVSITGESVFVGTQTLSATVKNSDSTVVTVDGGKSFNISDGDTFSIGENAYDGDTVVVNVEATNAYTTKTFTFKFKKVSQEEFDTRNNAKVFIKTDNGSAPYVYAWAGTSTVLAGKWPGTQLTEKDAYSGYYYIDLGELADGETYNMVINSGSGAQSDDITGLTGARWFTVNSSYAATEVDPVVPTPTARPNNTPTPNPKNTATPTPTPAPDVTATPDPNPSDVEGMDELKSEVKDAKSLVESDFTEDTWKALTSAIADAEDVIANANATKTDVSTARTALADADDALELASPSFTQLVAGTSRIKGLAPYGSAVTVTVGNKRYIAVTADKVTGVWSINAGSFTNSVKVTAYAVRDGKTSAKITYDLSSGNITIDSTPKPATTKPATVAPATTAPATTKPATKTPATTAPVTTTPNPSNLTVLYYNTAWSNVQIKYSLDNKTWTDFVDMNSTNLDEFKTITIESGSAARVYFYFTNGTEEDNNEGFNYFVRSGATYTLNDDTITKGAPAGISSSQTPVPATQTPAPATKTPTPATKTPAPTATPEPGDKTVTVYYYTGWSTPYMHYQIGSGEWTTVPGYAMQASGVSGYSVITVDLGTASSLKACFNNGNGSWDNNSGNDYSFTSAGTYTVKNGKITSSAPEGSQSSEGTITINYSTGWDTSYIHYKLGSGEWTTVPGVAMSDSATDGYSTITINLGTATNMTACFNNGSGNWDNNNSNNYYFESEGTYTVKDGKITAN